MDENLIIRDIEDIAEKPIAAIVYIFRDEEDNYRLRDENGDYTKPLVDILHDLNDGYTAIPF